MEEVCLELDLHGQVAGAWVGGGEHVGGRGHGQDLEKLMKTGRTREFMASQGRPSKAHKLDGY